MTRLTEDGYLETDSPIVASCFLGKLCNATRNWEVMPAYIGEETYISVDVDEYEYDYPLLVSARVVAEVASIDLWSTARPADKPLTEILDCCGIPDFELIDWLRKHTTEEG